MFVYITILFVYISLCLEGFKSMKILGKMGFADFQEDDIKLPGFYSDIPPSRGWGGIIREKEYELKGMA